MTPPFSPTVWTTITYHSTLKEQIISALPAQWTVPLMVCKLGYLYFLKHWKTIKFPTKFLTYGTHCHKQHEYLLYLQISFRWLMQCTISQYTERGLQDSVALCNSLVFHFICKRLKSTRSKREKWNSGTAHFGEKLLALSLSGTIVTSHIWIR